MVEEAITPGTSITCTGIPLKHGFVQRLVDWPYSSFHCYVESGLYPLIGPRACIRFGDR